MYSWGDDTSTWKNPGKYNYGPAKKPYLDGMAKEAESKGPKSYTSKAEPKLELVDPKGKIITSDSENVLLVGLDGTGSMQTMPAEFFDRASLLYQTLFKYRPDVEISFSVIGDAKWDKWPLQVSNFGKGVTLDDYLKALHAEGAGGPGIQESYELWGHYLNHNVKVPKAISPTLILIGDEKFYDNIDPDQVQKFIGSKLQAPIPSMEMWKQLAERFDIYMLRKSYSGHDEKVLAQWNEALGPQRIIPIEDPQRVVDVALGIVAKKWGNFGDFAQNLSARQDEPNIEKVMTSLRAVSVPIDTKSKIVGAGKPVKKSQKLVDE